MNDNILSFHEIDEAKISVVGGKGANLGELSKIPGVLVPEGFCVTTEVYNKIAGNNKELDCLMNELAELEEEDREKVCELSRKIRMLIEGIPISRDLEVEITSFLSKSGEKEAYAVRSSATAEDLPTASFAGQQDTYLNIIGSKEILRHIKRCWASLFTERAVTYRIHNGFDHRKVALAVVIQKMIFPEVSGIMFTADPVTSNRKVISVDAGFGLGEALVSGLVNADVYKVREGKLIDKKISRKNLAVYPVEGGGTKEKKIELEIQNIQALTDEQILSLTAAGKKIEEHFGYPQDIEWCFADHSFYFVQSRPITTLYPVPATDDDEKHVYISVGHQQMMTDPMKPLGLSLWLLTSGGPMLHAGGRAFVDVTHMLVSRESREVLLNNMGQHDPLIKDALMNLINRGEFLTPLPDYSNDQSTSGKNRCLESADILAQAGDKQDIVSDLIKRGQMSTEELRQKIRNKSGAELFDFIKDDAKELKRIIFDLLSMSAIITAQNASAWVNGKMQEWLGEKNAADILSQSVSDNITSQMGIDLLDVSDVIRPYPEVIEYLEHTKDENFLDVLPEFEGGLVVQDAILSYLKRFGMRCSGEIDMTRPRWSEKPGTLLPLMLSNIRNLKPHESKRKFQQGLSEALNKEKDLLERLKQLPSGDQKVKETKQMIDLIRNFSGYREYPKYIIVNRYFIYKQALLKEMEMLVQEGLIQEKEDLYYLTLDELQETINLRKTDAEIIEKRKEEYRHFEKLTPPRVITSDGEIVTGVYRREDLPEGAIIGLPVSSGVVEGRARVILSLGDADLEDGDILVTTFTDPSWTPLFVSVKGLVTEVGGLMTHGAVIAREYGLPAVVGVQNAIKLIKDGQRIRVNGTEGYVEIL